MRVACDAAVTVEVTADVVKLCPFRDEVDRGTLVVAWYAESHTLELHAFRAWLDCFATRRISHEDFTRLVASELTSLFSDTVEVVATWQTAGMAIAVAA